MKKLGTLSGIAVLGVTLLGGSFAEAHTVKHGESLWQIGQSYDVSYEQIKQANGLSSDILLPGQELAIPDAKKIQATDEERRLLASLVESEAEGEEFAGKVAVAAVVLNRVQDSSFPDSIKGVIYDPGQFQPVMEGTLKSPSAESLQAVDQALAGYDNTNGALFFYNPETAVSQWLDTKPVLETIGNHTFSR
ncbi:N-acetylmuramoyl-L-alanine amidase [Bacillus sp. OV194]|nr:N-acetylmuramoyl-L-alanine amidase [Bacillus sp. OV194]